MYLHIVPYVYCPLAFLKYGMLEPVPLEECTKCPMHDGIEGHDGDCVVCAFETMHPDATPDMVNNWHEDIKRATSRMR